MDDEGVPGGAPRQDQLLEEASLWFARMRGPDRESYQPDFDRWLALGAAHRGAYNRAGEIFALGKFLAETPDAETIEARNRVDPWISRRALALAACLVLLLGMGAWLGRDMIATGLSGPAQIAGEPSAIVADAGRVAAGPGERRSLTLADGSKVVLEPGSVLGTRFDRVRRELHLEKGRARFDVAHEKRPFVVFAGGGSVTARGTIFDVILDDDNEVTVRLLRGAVDVARPNRTAQADAAPAIVTRLAPGETLSFGAVSTRSLASAPAVAPFAVPAARRMGDAMEFEKASLAQVVAQANQGSAVSIRLADPAIGALEVSGRFRIDDPEQVAERLAALFNLKAERVGSGEIVLQARSANP